jgi:F420-dependent oxidoreductase-like protein
MEIGIFAGGLSGRGGSVTKAVEVAQRAADEGFASYWVPHIFSLDALTALAVVGHAVPGIQLGTSVVPTYSRHPIALAQQALTVQSASSGRLTLGIGLSHQMVIENMYGYSFEKPVRHMREYLEALMPLLRGEAASVSGEAVTARATLDVAEMPAPEVLVAALGPRMLELAATLTAGTVTWMTGPVTLAEHTVPTLTKAAGGRPMRVVAELPVCVTDDVAGAKEHAAKEFEVYGILPSYRAMLDREGAAGPVDVAIIGDEGTVRDGIDRLRQAGVTEFVAAEFHPGKAESARTRELLQSLQ